MRWYVMRVMLTGALGALVKKTKKVSFSLKITFSTLLNIWLHKFQEILTILVSVTSAPGAPVRRNYRAYHFFCKGILRGRAPHLSNTWNVSPGLSLNYMKSYGLGPDVLVLYIVVSPGLQRGVADRSYAIVGLGLWD